MKPLDPITPPITAQAAAARAETNRQNSLKSTGPRTPEGKDRVRFNAVTHGLTGKQIILHPEEQERYAGLLNLFMKKWRPSNEEEERLVLILRDAHWRRDSISAQHINLLTLATEEHLDDYEEYADDPTLQRAMAETAAFRSSARLFEQFGRHETRLGGIIKDTEMSLFRIVRARIERAEQQALNQALTESAKQSQPAPAKQSQPVAKIDLARLNQAIYGPKPTFAEPPAVFRAGK